MLIGSEPTDPGPPAGIPTAAAVMGRASGENFPVAGRLLGAGVRDDLLAIYGFARLVDELGDSAGGDRLKALDWLEGELDQAFAGSARHPLLVALQPALRRRELSREPFVRLIEANRMDQIVGSYQTWEQLREYCALSADPVGELVLEVFGLATPGRIALSNSVCTGLQLVEHCQDVAEDLAAGRVYLPTEDLERFGCAREQLGELHAGGPLRKVLAFEVLRARRLFTLGAPLVGQLRGGPRVAVAAFVAGGRAAAGAIERAGYDVLPGPPKAGRRRLLMALTWTLLQRHGSTA